MGEIWLVDRGKKEKEAALEETHKMSAEEAQYGERYLKQQGE